MKQQTLTIDERLSVPFREFEFTFARSSGPGGQNVNKLNTKVTLRWLLSSSTSLPEDVQRRFAARYARRINTQGDLLISSQRFRDQGRNVADCLAKLREMILAVAIPPKRRKPTNRTRGSREARLREKRNRSQSKHLRRAPAPDF